MATTAIAIRRTFPQIDPHGLPGGVEVKKIETAKFTSADAGGVEQLQDEFTSAWEQQVTHASLLVVTLPPRQYPDISDGF